jgi:hypothetical protein
VAGATIDGFDFGADSTSFGGGQDDMYVMGSLIMNSGTADVSGATTITEDSSNGNTWFTL